jgi:hypothetical protein
MAAGRQIPIRVRSKEKSMSELSRRNLLRVTGAAAVAVPITALASPADARTSHADVPARRATPEEVKAFGSGPVMFAVHDVARGEVSILHGQHEVVVRDRDLVNRIVKAAQRAQKRQ